MEHNVQSRQKTEPLDLAVANTFAAPSLRRGTGQLQSSQLAGLGGEEDTTDTPTTIDPTLNPDTDEDRADADADQHTPQLWQDERPFAGSWGAVEASCHGVPAYNNDGSEANQTAFREKYGVDMPMSDAGPVVPTTYGMAYQCVEFVKRYYAVAMGIVGMGSGDAKNFLTGPRGGLEIHLCPGPIRPQAGDLMVRLGGPTGHVGIVSSVEGATDDSEAITVHVVQQNEDSATSPHTFTKTDGIWECADGKWDGFRRLPSTSPVEEIGGGDQATGEVDMGELVEIADGETMWLDTIASTLGNGPDGSYTHFYDVLRQLNPLVPDLIEGPAVILTQGEPNTFGNTPIGTLSIMSGRSLRTVPDRRRAPVLSAPDGVNGIPFYDVQPDAGVEGAQMYKVIDYKGDTYWISSESVTDVSQTAEAESAESESAESESAEASESALLPQPIGTVSFQNVNVRSQPSLMGAVQGSYSMEDTPIYGSQESAEDQRTWYQIQLPNGTMGWVASWVVEEELD